MTERLGQEGRVPGERPGDPGEGSWLDPDETDCWEPSELDRRLRIRAVSLIRRRADLDQAPDEVKRDEIRRCAQNPHHWLAHHVWTLERHGGDVDAPFPIKPFPIVELEYVQDLVDAWLTCPVLWVGKSRQVLASWTFVALNLWLAQFHHGRLCIFQSQSEKHAHDLIARAKVMLEEQPRWLVPEYEALKQEITFHANRSQLLSIPAGADQARTFTASSYFFDEAAFQREAEEAYAGVYPTVVKGGMKAGRLSVVSSANPGFFEDGFLGRLNKRGA